MSTVINPKGALRSGPGVDPLAWSQTYVTSSVGSKVLVALTGLGLVGFLVGHLIGNLKLFNGRDAINHYAHFLKHDLGVLIWLARGGLLALFVGHLYLALRLQARTAAARPVAYLNRRNAQAGLASQTMMWTGIVIFAFLCFHLAHYTFGWVHEADLGNGRQINYLDLKDDQGRHDVYSMVVAGFTTPWIAGFYVICQALLTVHLIHGIPSTFQTLGLNSRRFAGAIRALGAAIALSIFAGNVGIVVAVAAGFVPPVYPMVR